MGQLDIMNVSRTYTFYLTIAFTCTFQHSSTLVETSSRLVNVNSTSNGMIHNLCSVQGVGN